MVHRIRRADGTLAFVRCPLCGPGPDVDRPNVESDRRRRRIEAAISASQCARASSHFLWYELKLALVENAIDLDRLRAGAEMN